MADTSRTQLWTMPAAAIAAALALAACGSSGGGGAAGDPCANPTSQEAIGGCALAAANTALADANEQAGAASVQEVDEGDDPDHTFNGEVAHLRINQGDSSLATAQVDDVYAAQVAVGAEGDTDSSTYIGAVEADIRMLEMLRDEAAAAGNGDRAAFYEGRIADLEDRKDDLLEVKARIDAEVERIEAVAAVNPNTEAEDRDYGEDVANRVGVEIHEAIRDWTRVGQAFVRVGPTFNSALPEIRENLVRRFEFPVFSGTRAGDLVSETRAVLGAALVSRPIRGNQDAELISLEGAMVSAYTNSPRLRESADASRARLNADGTGWIRAGMAEADATPFAIANPVTAKVYVNGYLFGDEVHCLRLPCTVENGQFVGDWYALFDEEAGGSPDTRYSRIETAGEDDLIQYAEDTFPYLVFGYWLDLSVPSQIRTRAFFEEKRAGDPGIGFNLQAADLTDQDPLNDEATATYSGMAAGMSVRTEERMEGPDGAQTTVTYTHSGRFLADAELTATFGGTTGALAASLSGTINNFRAEGNPQAVAEADPDGTGGWSVTLESTPLTDSGLTDTVGATVAMDGSRVGNGWYGFAYGNDDRRLPTARPAGFYGTFEAAFDDGRAYGAFVSEKD